MRKCPTFVIPSAARYLVFSATYEEEISRLHLEMTVATQSPSGDRVVSGFLLAPLRRIPLPLDGEDEGGSAVLTLHYIAIGNSLLNLRKSSDNSPRRRRARGARGVKRFLMKIIPNSANSVPLRCNSAFFLRCDVFSRRPDRLRVAARRHIANLAAVSFAVFVDPFEHRGDIRKLVAYGLHYFDQIVRAVFFFLKIGE